MSFFRPQSDSHLTLAWYLGSSSDPQPIYSILSYPSLPLFMVLQRGCGHLTTAAGKQGELLAEDSSWPTHHQFPRLGLLQATLIPRLYTVFALLHTGNYTCGTVRKTVTQAHMLVIFFTRVIIMLHQSHSYWKQLIRAPLLEAGREGWPGRYKA